MEQDRHSVRDFLNVIFKHKVRISAVFLAVVAVVIAITFLVPPTYQSRSVVLVKLGREYIYRSEVGDDGPTLAFSPANQEELVNTEIKIMTNPDLIRRVLATFGVEKLYPEVFESPVEGVPPIERAIVKFQEALSVSGVKKSNIIEIAYEHKQPDMASKAVNLLVDLYKEKHLQVYSDPQSSFLQAQLTSYRERLKASEDGLQSYKQQHGIYSLDEQRDLLLGQRIELDAALKDNQNRIQESRHRLASLKKQIGSLLEKAPLYTASERDQIITSTKARLLEAQIREQDLLSRYNENSRLVQTVRKEIQMAKDFLAEEEKDISAKVRTGNAIYQEVEKDRIKSETELVAQEARYPVLKRQVEQTDGELKSLDLGEKGFLDLKRQLLANEKHYQNYLDKFEEARISDDMNKKKIANISVVQTAATPVEPIRPQKGLNGILAIVFGAASGLGVAFLSEHTAQGMSTPESVERRIRLPVLATIPLRKT
ncbi:MAG: GumC family protein [Pseudomonadota bacterium]